MNAALQLSGLRPHQVELLQRTVARDLTREEFDLFVETAERHRLDPFRRHIVPIVLRKHDREHRQMIPLVTIEGQRIIAHRCENYRPASGPTEFVFGRNIKSPANPHGLKLARVRLWRQDNLGEWFPVVGEAFWDEFAPVLEEQRGDDLSGRIPGRRFLNPDSAWARMPRLMLAKCATAQALRAGWPDQFGGLYGEDEFDRTRTLDLAAAETAERLREERSRRAQAARDSILVTFDQSGVLESVPLSDFYLRARRWIETRPAAAACLWADANRDALREFWDRSPSEALALKQLIETRSAATRDGQP